MIYTHDAAPAWYVAHHARRFYHSGPWIDVVWRSKNEWVIERPIKSGYRRGKTWRRTARRHNRQLRNAIMFLEYMLWNVSGCASRDIMAVARIEGVSWRTIVRAADFIDVKKSKPKGRGVQRRVIWRLKQPKEYRGWYEYVHMPDGTLEIALLERGRLELIRLQKLARMRRKRGEEWIDTRS